MTTETEQTLESGSHFSATLPDAGGAAKEKPIPMRELKESLRELYRSNAMGQATQLLEGEAAKSDRGRGIKDNLWLYVSLAEIYREQQNSKAFCDALLQAFSYDPIRKSILVFLVELLPMIQDVDTARVIANNLLLFHLDTLSTEERRFTYAQLSVIELANDAPEAARDALEKALQEAPNHRETIEQLIEVLKGLELHNEVVQLRRRLLNQLTSPVHRANQLLQLGNDYLHQFHDPEHALEIFDQALTEDPGNVSILDTYLSAASAAEDWSRAYEAMIKLAKASQKEPVQAADWYFRAANVARDELWKPELATANFQNVLRIDPTRLDAFQALTSIYVDAKNWTALQETYNEEIVFLNNLQQTPQISGILSIMWQKLGELYRVHIVDDAKAIEAYSRATQYEPNSIPMHRTVVEFAEANADHLDKATIHLRELLRLEPMNTEHVERLAKVFLRMKKHDAALCTYRVLEVLGRPLEQRARTFVDRFSSPVFQAPPFKLRPAFLKTKVYEPALKSKLTPIFGALKPGLEEWVGHQASHYGLKKRDRVDISEQLIFNNIFRAIGVAFEYTELPAVYRKSDQIGMINGGIIPDQFLFFGSVKVGGLIAGDDLLTSVREQYNAFAIAKQLFLFQPEFYLATLRPASDLTIFLSIAQSICGQAVQLPDSADIQSAKRAIKKNTDADELNALQFAVLKYRNESIAEWLEAIETTANRVGLLFANSLRPCIDYLQIETQWLGSRTSQQRILELVDFYLSDAHFQVRQELGSAID